VKIKIGLAVSSHGWAQLCAQEGIPSAVVPLTLEALQQECSILVVNRTLSAAESGSVEAYLRGGGAIIGSTRYLQSVAGLSGTGQELSYVVADGTGPFTSVQLLDIGAHGLIPVGANAMRTETNNFAILAGALGGGFAVALPFDPDTLMTDGRAANKSFYTRFDRLPAERVSLVGKGELRHLVADAFRYLHAARGIPYPHLWYFPGGASNVFAFRIDTDGASRADVDLLHEAGRDAGVNMTWFVDVRSHEAWLSHFNFLTGQEIALHCYDHVTHPTVDGNRKNIARGLQELHRAGIRPRGFAAPFGIWNPGLAQAIDDAGLFYSSEFSYAYDTFPILPASTDDVFATMQIPIHPICVGSMLKCGYTDDRMREYFKQAIERKRVMREPLFFYHHPSHTRWDVVRSILQSGDATVINVTMSEYADFWVRRNSIRWEAQYVQNELAISSNVTDDDVRLCVVLPGGGEILQRLQSGKAIIAASAAKQPVLPPPPPADIRRIREFDPRQFAGDIFTTFLRKFQ
jgi:hypothetical protein